MNEIQLGGVTVTRVEQVRGPSTPTSAFFATMPNSAWDEHQAELVPTT